MRPLPAKVRSTHGRAFSPHNKLKATNIHSNRRVTNKLHLKFEPNKNRNGKVVSTSFTLSYRILTLIGPLPKYGESYPNHVYLNLKVMNELCFKFGPNWARNGKFNAIIVKKTYFPVFPRSDMKCPKSLILILPKFFSFINSFIASPMRLCFFFNVWTLCQ